MDEVLKEVVIYTDGAAEPNPGPGGYGAVLIYGGRRKELSGAFYNTTNNRMEIFAAIAGLEALKEPCAVILHSDSKYLVDAMTQGWVNRWRQNDWRLNKKTKAANTDLWERLLAMCKKHRVKFVCVKGHAGIPENERCDQLAQQFASKHNLPVDKGYEQRPKTKNFKHVKMAYEGQPCRNCSTPVIKRIPRSKPKQNSTYYFEYYLYCPECRAMYMIEDAKRTC